MCNPPFLLKSSSSFYDSEQEECASATLNVYQNDDAKGIIQNG